MPNEPAPVRPPEKPAKCFSGFDFFLWGESWRDWSLELEKRAAALCNQFPPALTDAMPRGPLLTAILALRTLLDQRPKEAQ